MITSRATEAKNLTTKQKLMQLPHLKYFNPSFFNKWQVYQMLVTDPQLKRYLPETKDLTPENFKGMLQKYNTLFVKPSNGSLGKGIIKVTRNSGGAVSFVIYGKGKVKNYAENAEEFFKKTTRIRGDKPYIVQQGLNLALYKGATFDLRIIYQKNKEGNWQLGKKFVRVAPRGSSISNLSSGGRVEISKRVLKYLFHNKERIENKNEEIKEFCLRVAKILEEKNNAIYGELGMDIGIDKQGALWLIEVNSKPRKTTETEFSTAVMRRTFLRPLEFASYLAGFPVK
jgi:glutathione synthase/RimK-type ligase-like ATP-grasp enzyme